MQVDDGNRAFGLALQAERQRHTWLIVSRVGITLAMYTEAMMPALDPVGVALLAHHQGLRVRSQARQAIRLPGMRALALVARADASGIQSQHYISITLAKASTLSHNLRFIPSSLPLMVINSLSVNSSLCLLYQCLFHQTAM